MSGTITCPNCDFAFEMSEVMSAQLRSGIRRELEQEVDSKKKQLADRERELKQRSRELEEAKQAVEDRVRAQVKSEREKLIVEARAKAGEELAVELRDRDQRETELRAKLKETQQNELALRKREREMQEEKEVWELQKTREVEAERIKIRDAARKQADEDSQLKLREKDHQIEGMRKQIDDLKRKSEQGSQQTQGEVQELALEDLLRQKFPTDSIDEVGKGVSGADALQSVRTPGGADAGSILWESKRTKRWSNDWLPKLRKDQREAKANIAVIVSAVLPDDVDTFEMKDGVWVCGWSFAPALASALRAGLLETASARRAMVGRQDKMEQVYSYLASPDFRNRVTGIGEAFVTMQQDLAKEKRAIQTQWAKREKQIEQALANTVGMYGDMQGIIGGALPQIDGFDLRMLESQPQQ